MAGVEGSEQGEVSAEGGVGSRLLRQQDLVGAPQRWVGRLDLDLDATPRAPGAPDQLLVREVPGPDPGDQDQAGVEAATLGDAVEEQQQVLLDGLEGFRPK